MFYSKTMSGEKTTRQFTPKTRKNTKHSHEMDIEEKAILPPDSSYLRGI